MHNFTDAGRGQVEVIILDPKGNRNTVPCRVRKTEDNVYRCEYVAQTTGMHSVNVFFAGQQIPKSPFGVKVTPGKVTKLSLTELFVTCEKKSSVFYCLYFIKHLFYSMCIFIFSL